MLPIFPHEFHISFPAEYQPSDINTSALFIPHYTAAEQNINRQHQTHDIDIRLIEKHK